MGGWMIYCAICGGPFSNRMDMDPEGTDDHSYRYDVLKDCDLEWLLSLRGLGFNPNAAGGDGTFITGVGRYWDYGSICVPAGDDPFWLYPDSIDPDATGDFNMVAYHDWADNGESHVFPFHPICYDDILQRCISQGSHGQIQKKALWNAFESLNGGRFVRLQLDYGTPEPGEEQFWHSMRGEEVLVVNPVKIPEIHIGLASIMESLTHGIGLGQLPRYQDPFDKLPAELRHVIFQLLPVGSILALKAVSYAMHTTSLPAGWWERRMRCEIPWLWELRDIDLFQSQDVERKAAEMLLDIQSRSQYIPTDDDYILGLANRRRIWGVCEEIRSQYLGKLGALSTSIATTEAKE